MDEQTANLILMRAPALSGAQFYELIAQYGSSADILSAGVTAWRDAELHPRCVEFLGAARGGLVDDERRWLDDPQRHLLMFGSTAYPRLLQEIPDAPLGLFVSGNAELLNSPQLAMVGSRNPTPYGRELAEAFAKHLSLCGLTVTSGLAAGIDAASHRGAMAGSGLTVAVCGTGLDEVYPASSARLAEDIRLNGVLVSEFPPGTRAKKHHFPQRNRIISGLSLGTLVVEATLQSGSLITARLAGDQGREVFAIPGSVHNPMAKGCHQLIRQGAKLVDSAEDILNELGPLAAALHITAQPEPHKRLDLQGNSQARLDKDRKILLDALGFEPLGVDHLVIRTGLKAEVVASSLLVLELEGRIESYPGGLYVRSDAPAGP